MLTILPQVIKEEPDSKEVIFEARDNEVPAGCLTAVIAGKKCTLTNINGADKFVADGICRAALSYALSGGAKTAHFNECPDVISALGYTSGMDIKSFFDKNCKNSL